MPKQSFSPFILVGSVFFIAIALGISYFYLKTISPQTTNSETSTLSITPVAKGETKITSLSPDSVVITGPNGNMTLTNDPAIVHIYKEDAKGFRQEINFSDLQMNQTVIVEIVKPGELINIIMSS